MKREANKRSFQSNSWISGKISGSANFFRKYGNIRSEVFQWAKPIRILYEEAMRTFPVR
jgi:hypothetical protein